MPTSKPIANNQKKGIPSLLQNNLLAKDQVAYQKVCELDPMDYESWLNLGAIHGGRGMLLEAEYAFLKALAINPRFAGAHWNRAQLRLQAGKILEGWEGYEWRLKMPELFVNLGGESHFFADTAAAIANLDCVISVDTSVAHLAGAMNKPVYFLLSYSSEWRMKSLILRL